MMLRSARNDVYLTAGDSISKEGRYINVISPYTGASTAKPIQIHSEDRTVENTEIGTQLVRYTTDAGGDTAAAKADEDGIFVPSWKMPGGSGHWTEQGGRKDRLDDLRTGC